MLHILEKEGKRRLPAGTLVIGTCQYLGEQSGVSTIIICASVRYMQKLVQWLINPLGPIEQSRPTVLCYCEV